MLKRLILLCIVAAVTAGLTTSCILDPEKKKDDPNPPVVKDFKSLKEKDDVLWNLELAYNLRERWEFEKLLDADFLFFFSEADYSTGNIPESWNRVSEIKTHINLFNENLDSDLRATNIDLTLSYTPGEWTEIPQGDESWYSMEVIYNITVQTKVGVDYKGNNLKAQFIIREAIPDGETEKIWRIVRWRDIGDE